MIHNYRQRTLLGLGPHGFHRIAYYEWGDPEADHIVVCVHGLTRNARDFDVLAASLADRCRVVCLDVVGRGASDWLDHKPDYGFDQYLADAAVLLARLTAPRPPRLRDRLFGHRQAPRPPVIDWIGTSMGGLMGMMLAARRGSPLRRLVLNDVGPLVPWPALVRLKTLHAGQARQFADLAEAEAHLRAACAGFGPLSDERWREVARHSVRPLEGGGYIPAFDPGIIGALRNGANAEVEFGNDFLWGVDLWPVWSNLDHDVLVLRGGESDILLPETAAEMQRRKPRTRVIEFPGIGHAPWLASRDQIGPISDFLFAQNL